jgi:thiamine biosynthesis lipoprotein
MRTRKYLPAVIVVVVVLSIALVRNFRGNGGFYSTSVLMMDTLVEVSVWGKARVSAQAGVDSALAVMAAVDSLFGGGMVLPASSTGAAESKEFADVMLLATEVHNLSGGLFDPTVGSVSRLWRFGEGAEVPCADSLKKALERVGLPRYLADPDSREFILDLGGVAKGYAVEHAAAKLADLGFRSAIINAGGDMRLLGKRPDGKPWRIAIRHPRREDAFAGYLDIENAAVATSGDYERCFFVEGRRYHHILDPRTGMPGGASASVTVVGPEGSLSDALATALFLMGPGEGRRLAESLPGIGAVFVFADGESVEVTANLESKFQRAALE